MAKCIADIPAPRTILQLIGDIRTYLPQDLSPQARAEALGETFSNMQTKPEAYHAERIDFGIPQDANVGDENIPERGQVVRWYHQGNSTNLNRNGPNVAIVERVLNVYIDVDCRAKWATELYLITRVPQQETDDSATALGVRS
jgi:hypothetical protein